MKIKKMEDFDLRKYLAKNKLLKEGEDTRFKEPQKDKHTHKWEKIDQDTEECKVCGLRRTIYGENKLTEVNEDPNQKKYSWEEVKHELELNALMAARLIAHQAKGREHAVWEDLVADLMAMARRSKIPTQFDFLEDWYNSQRNNELPNTSSGSFFTGLTDIDGLLSAMNFEEYVEFEGESDSDEMLYTDEEYDKAAAYHNMLINQEVPDWNKY